MSEILDALETIVIESPADLIVRQIRELIRTGRLRPGDKLPSEAALQEKFQVKRTVVREALKRLEFYGILKTIPQSGTIVSSLGPQALEGLLSNILRLERDDYESLIDTRMVLEGRAAALVAEKGSKKFLEEIESCKELYESKAKSGDRGLHADIALHLKIAEATQSSVLNSLISILSPDILSMFAKLSKTCENRLNETIVEHNRIIEAIRDKDPQRAEAAMRDHILKGYQSSGG